MCSEFPIDGPLNLWLNAKNVELFPGGLDYRARYTTIADFLAKHVHTEVEKGVILQQIAEGVIDRDRVVYLNNHGPGHVDKVIAQASAMLQKANARMTPYEAYILLTAIQFHDVGCINGRAEHEKKCRAIMNKLGQLMGEDRPEITAIAKIAAAHGGCVDGDADTLGKLQSQVALLNQYVRKQYLAALLRFADELADDRSRASRFLLEDHRIPPGSEIYHAYSHALHAVMVEATEVLLRFEIDTGTALRKFDKGSKRVYLLDEIYERTLKMHRERIYCTRFLRPCVNLHRIRVKVEVCEIETDVISDPVEKIDYSLEERGYPHDPKTTIYTLCPELDGKDGKWLRSKLK